MSRATYVVTGGTGGIGLHTAEGLARTGGRVVVTGRDEARGRRAVDSIRESTGNSEVHLALGDLAVRTDVEALGRRLVERFERIDVLVNNAGLLALERQVTVDGLEANFAVNVAAPWWLTRAVLPALRAAPRPRVVNLTGGMPIGGLDVANLQAEKGFVGLPAYSHSKRAMEAMSLALRDELAADGVEVVIVHPGGASTSMTRGMTAAVLPWWARPMWPVFRLFTRDDGGRSAAKASRSTLFASSAADLPGDETSYLTPDSTPRALHRSVLDRVNQARVVDAIQMGER